MWMFYVQWFYYIHLGGGINIAEYEYIFAYKFLASHSDNVVA